MLRWMIPLGLAACPVVANAASAPSAALPLPSNAWWEKVTVKMTGDGEAQNCQYSTSRSGSPQADCKVIGASGLAAQSASSATSSSAKDGGTTITFERRFNPGTKPSPDALQPGETLLGGQTLALAIDGKGSVKDCKVVQRSGSLPPQYGCDEAAAERFDASASTGRARTPQREGYMTILVYGHSEHIV